MKIVFVTKNDRKPNLGQIVTKMIGNDIFEDLAIDAYEVEIELESISKTLVDQWGSKLTEGDLLRLNAMRDSNTLSVENVLAKYILQYYLTKDYNPEFIHKTETKVNKKSWWKFW